MSSVIVSATVKRVSSWIILYRLIDVTCPRLSRSLLSPKLTRSYSIYEVVSNSVFNLHYSHIRGTEVSPHARHLPFTDDLGFHGTRKDDEKKSIKPSTNNPCIGEHSYIFFSGVQMSIGPYLVHQVRSLHWHFSSQ